MNTRQLTKVALGLSVLLLVLYGCGFQLRTTSLSSQVASVEVSSIESPRIASALERGLSRLGIGVESVEAPDVRVHIYEHEFLQAGSLFIPRGGLVEYEITLEVHIGIEVADEQEEPLNTVLTEAQRVAVNAENLLSTSAEDEVVRQELVDKIVDSIIRLIASVVSQPSTDSP
ncbi:MAG: hypothetical protein OXG08_13480 [Gammaproteobacteria bacterium]|nr:hypothetical protein [Gammaproteobacteria bacterium]